MRFFLIIVYFYNDYKVNTLSGKNKGLSRYSVVLGKDKSIVETPYVITGLQGETKYFLRMKSLSFLHLSIVPLFDLTHDSSVFLIDPSTV